MRTSIDNGMKSRQCNCKKIEKLTSVMPSNSSVRWMPMQQFHLVPQTSQEMLLDDNSLILRPTQGSVKFILEQLLNLVINQWWRDLFRCTIDLLNFSMGFNIIAPYMDFLHLNWCIAEWNNERSLILHLQIWKETYGNTSPPPRRSCIFPFRIHEELLALHDIKMCHGLLQPWLHF